MAFGKFRNGPTSLGRQAANWMQDNDKFSFATRRRGNVVARKSGEFTNIYQQPDVALDGYYALGDVQDTGTRVLASAYARGVFADRGPAPDNGGFVLSELGFYGKGWGVMTTSDPVTGATDFDGDPAFIIPRHVLRTPNGRSLTDIYTYYLAIPQEALGGTLTYQISGGYHYVGTKATFSTGTVFTGLDGDGQYLQAFIYDDGRERSLGATEYVLNQIGWFASPTVLAPGVILKMDRYLRPSDTVTTIVPLACPGLRFNYTTDGGLSWANAVDTMFATELATITGLAIGDWNYFNAAISAAQLLSAPLSRTLAVAIGHVPYIETVGATKTVKVKVKMGLINTGAGCTLSASTTLFDGLPDDAVRFLSRTPLAIPGGVLVFTRPAAGGLEAGAPGRIMFTDDGINLTERAFFPLPEYQTGVVTGIDTKTLVCPMYDGLYTLYESKDWGATWSGRATITENGVPPATGQLVMGNFSILTMLRKEGLPANAAPATPWHFDCRIDPP